VGALAGQHVEANLTLLQTVIANYLHPVVLVLGRHLRCGNLLVHVGFDNQRVNQGLLANWARNICAGVLLQALSVHAVSTASKRRSFNRVLHVLHAYGAVLLKPLLHTLMVVLHGDVEAAVADVAMESVLFASHAADATLVAMKDALGFGLVVVKCAN